MSENEVGNVLELLGSNEDSFEINEHEFKVRSAYEPPRWLSGKESLCQAEDANSIPRLGRFPGEGNGSPLQYFCLGNPIDRGAWQATVHGVTKESDTVATKQCTTRRTHQHRSLSNRILLHFVGSEISLVLLVLPSED